MKIKFIRELGGFVYSLTRLGSSNNNERSFKINQTIKSAGCFKAGQGIVNERISTLSFDHYVKEIRQRKP